MTSQKTGTLHNIILNSTEAGVYKITNLVTGKFYLGSSKNMRHRTTQHKNALLRGDHHSLKLQRSFNKHGGEAFKSEVLLVCSQQDMWFYEARALDVLEPYKTGYNCSERPECYIRENNTLLHNERIRAAHTGMTHTRETRQKLRDYHLGLNRGKRYTYRGEKLTVRQWAERLGTTYNKLQHRVRFLGSFAAAVETPAKTLEEAAANARKTFDTVQYRGGCFNMSSLARHFNINRKKVMYWRDKTGSIEKAIEYLEGKYKP